jgi:hypothetical protein
MTHKGYYGNVASIVDADVSTVFRACRAMLSIGLTTIFESFVPEQLTKEVLLKLPLYHTTAPDNPYGRREDMLWMLSITYGS